MAESPSPCAKPRPGLRIKPGAPAPERPGRDERDALEARLKTDAATVLDDAVTAQRALTDAGTYDLGWLRGRHVIVAGATGQGLGGALAAATLPRLGERGTLSAVARDIRFSLGYYSAEALKSHAETLGLGERFRFYDRGMALEGEPFDAIATGLKDVGASDVVYFNMVAAANSGVLPGHPPIHVTDVDAEGLFQWELKELTDKQIEGSRFVMGEMAVQFPARLADAGVTTAIEGYAGWRGSHDKISRLPERVEYGRQGAYSGSLWLPKDVLDAHVDKASEQPGAGSRIVQTHMFPIMRTRALGFIPGGLAMAGVYETIMRAHGVEAPGVPEQALRMLHAIGRTLAGEAPNPWPRHDLHEVQFDAYFAHVAARLTEDEASPYHYRRWIKPGA